MPASAIFGFSLLVVFLILAAQYQSWSLPFAVLLGTPIAINGMEDHLHFLAQFATKPRRHPDGVQPGHSICTVAHGNASHVHLPRVREFECVLTSCAQSDHGSERGILLVFAPRRAN